MFTSSHRAPTPIIAHPPPTNTPTIDPFTFIEAANNTHSVLSKCNSPISKREISFLYSAHETTQTTHKKRKLQKIDELIKADGEAMIETQRMFFHYQNYFNNNH